MNQVVPLELHSSSFCLHASSLLASGASTNLETLNRHENLIHRKSNHIAKLTLRAVGRVVTPNIILLIRWMRCYRKRLRSLLISLKWHAFLVCGSPHHVTGFQRLFLTVYYVFSVSYFACQAIILLCFAITLGCIIINFHSLSQWRSIE